MEMNKTISKKEANSKQAKVTWKSFEIIFKVVAAILIFGGILVIIQSLPTAAEQSFARAIDSQPKSMYEVILIMDKNSLINQINVLASELEFSENPKEVATLFKRKDSLINELRPYTATVYQYRLMNPLARGERQNKQQNTEFILEYYHPSELVNQEAIELNQVRWHTPNNANPDCFPGEDENKCTEASADLSLQNQSIEELLFVTYSRYDRYHVYFYTIDGGFKAKSSLNNFYSERIPSAYLEQCFFEFQYRDSGSSNQQFTGTISLPLKNIRFNQSFDSNGNPFIQPILEWFEFDISGNRVKRKLYLPKSYLSRTRLEAFLVSWKKAQECCISSGI